MSADSVGGLFTHAQPVPLEGVRIEATLVGPCIDVTLIQRFRNVEAMPVEVVYVFPLEEGAAVCGFDARIGARSIQGHVEERERAFAAYDDALLDGHSACLLDQERPNVFTASLGNLGPGEAAELRIRYVALARRQGTARRLAIPTTVAPRYVPAEAPRAGQPEGERVNPDRRLEVPYGLQLRVDIEEPGVRQIDCPSHPIRTELTPRGATVELSQEHVALDRDFVLLVEIAEPHAPFARFHRSADGSVFAMVSVLPSFEPRAETAHEVVFLLDCSRSMAGASIQQARRALALCVRVLGADDTFNIGCFGSRHTWLWPVPRGLDEVTLEEASKFIDSVDANLGGTEILGPLSAVLNAPADPQRPRRVLLLTDGQVSNEVNAIALARLHADATRIFAFGIGAGASEHLVRGIARASRGAAEMISPGERIEPKVMRMFARVGTPVLDGVRVVWNADSVQPAPACAPPVFGGDELVAFARLGGMPHEIELRVGGGRWRLAVEGSADGSDGSDGRGGAIALLWARERIRELEEGDVPGSVQERSSRVERKRAQLIELGTRHGLLSSATSYVAVSRRPSGDRIDQPAELRRIPVALTKGWGGGGVSTGVGEAAPASTSILATVHGRRRRENPSEAHGRVRERGIEASHGWSTVVREVGSRLCFEAEPMDPHATEADPLIPLLMTQRADGHFERSRPLLHWLGETRAGRLLAAIDAHGEALAVTALIVALVTTEAADRRSEWLLAVSKARSWLATAPSRFDGSLLL